MPSIITTWRSKSPRGQTAEQGQGQLELNVWLTVRLGCGRLLHGGSFLPSDIDIAPSTTGGARKEPSLYVTISAADGTSPWPANPSHLIEDFCWRCSPTLPCTLPRFGNGSERRDEVVEAALAHTVRNPTEAAYARSDLFERRRRLGRGVALRPTAEVGTVSLRVVAGRRATRSTLR